MTNPTPEPTFSAEDEARFAAGDALVAAEIAWLRAVADAAEDRYRDIDAAGPPAAASLGARRSFHEVERAAFLAYMRAPAPDGHGLAGKLLAAERWASELAQDGGDALLLVEGLAAIRADVIRLA